jgi:hypothetical protein
MDRRTVLAFILIGAILIVWLYLNSPKPPTGLPGNKNDTTLVRKDTVQGPADIQQEEEAPKKLEQKEETDTLNLGKFFNPSDGKEKNNYNRK